VSGPSLSGLNAFGILIAIMLLNMQLFLRVTTNEEATVVFPLKKFKTTCYSNCFPK